MHREKQASFATVDLLHMTYKASMKPTNTILFSLLLHHFPRILYEYRLEKFLCISLRTKYLKTRYDTHLPSGLLLPPQACMDK